MTRQRRHFTAEQKVALLREHFLDKVPVSDLCEKHGIGVTLFYSWQKLLFENAHLAFENGRKSKGAEDAKEKEIEQLEAKVQLRLFFV